MTDVYTDIGQIENNIINAEILDNKSYLQNFFYMFIFSSTLAVYLK